MRDMRDALGALGPVDGQNPELNNLTCSMTYVDEGDLVFLTSDGISDNFDPVVGKFVLPKKEEAENGNQQQDASSSNGPAMKEKLGAMDSNKPVRLITGSSSGSSGGREKYKHHSARQQQLLQKYHQIQQQQQKQQVQPKKSSQRNRHQQGSSVRSGFKQV